MYDPRPVELSEVVAWSHGAGDGARQDGIRAPPLPARWRGFLGLRGHSLTAPSPAPLRTLRIIVPATLLLGGLGEIACVAAGALARIILVIVMIGIRDDLIRPLGSQMGKVSSRQAAVPVASPADAGRCRALSWPRACSGARPGRSRNFHRRSEPGVEMSSPAFPSLNQFVISGLWPVSPRLRGRPVKPV